MSVILQDCMDFICFACLGQLHHKHDIQLQNAEENIKKSNKERIIRRQFH